MAETHHTRRMGDMRYLRDFSAKEIAVSSGYRGGRSAPIGQTDMPPGSRCKRPDKQ